MCLDQARSSLHMPMMNRDGMHSNFQGRNPTDEWIDDIKYPGAGSRVAAIVAQQQQQQQPFISRRSSDFSSFPSHLQEESQRSDSFHASINSAEDLYQLQQQQQQQIQRLPDRSNNDQRVRYLEQRIRDEATRASVAEQAYLRAREESRILQQAYLSLSPTPLHSGAALPPMGLHPSHLAGHAQPSALLPVAGMEHYASTATIPSSLSSLYPQHSSISVPMQYPMGVAHPNLSPNFPYPQQRVDNLSGLRPFSNYAAAPSMDQHHQQLQVTRAESKAPSRALAIVKYLGNTVQQGQAYMDVTKLEGLENACCDGDDTPKKPPSHHEPSKSFPEKLHALVAMAESDEQLREIVTFCPHGRAFQVLDIARFCAEIVPKFFTRLGQWKSFTRQLNLYGFTRISYGPDAGGYYHPLFLRNHAYLCRFMTRVGVTTAGVDRRYKSAKAPKEALQQTPDFYGMDPVT
ncbi:hypothetical protein MPSEU_000405900 [Mayamaea pseudoterrestris]|nr:hypothetical protein MPSEU_000405900 [Mayamaea pseudoterrestris]